MNDDLPFYVYVLSRDTGQPFYVGMGQGQRIAMHEKVARSNDKSEKSHIIRKIWAAGKQVHRSIDKQFKTSDEAKAFEIELIARIGRKDLGAGPLVNRTDGGEGTHGFSEETRRKHRERTRQAMSDPKVLEGCRMHMKRLCETTNFRENVNEQIRTYWLDEKNRAAQSLRSTNFIKKNPVAFAEGVEVRKVGLRSQESRKKMSLAKLGKKQSPELVAKRAEAIRKAGKPSDIGQRISAGKAAAKMRRLAEALL